MIDSLKTIIKFFSELFDTDESEIKCIFENAFRFSAKADSEMQDVKYDNARDVTMKCEILQHMKALSQPSNCTLIQF